MKLNKRLKVTVNKLVKLSLNKNGVIDDKKAFSHAMALKKLSTVQAILALSEFTKSIKREIAKTTQLIEYPSLGGTITKFGDTLIDDSIQNRIDQLKERIMHG